MSDEDRVFLKTIPAEIDDGAIRAAFAVHGNVIDVYVPRHQTGATKYGFVKFSDSAVVAQVVALQEIVIDGQSLPLEVASRRPSNKYAANSGPSQAAYQQPYFDPYQQQQQQAPQHPNASRHADRVFCKDVPMSITNDDMKEYWKQFGEIQDIYMPKDHTNPANPHRGMCFVSYHDAEAANRALAESQHTINGSMVTARRADPKPERGSRGPPPMQQQYHQPQQHYMPPQQQYMPPPMYHQPPPQMMHHGAAPMHDPHAPMPHDPHGTAPPAQEAMQAQYSAYMGEVQPAAAATPSAAPYGAPAPAPAYGAAAPYGQALHAPYIQSATTYGGAPQYGGGGGGGEPRNRVFVGGVPEELTPAAMKDHFSNFGVCEDVYYPKGQDGRNRGFAYVRFSTEQEAGDAVAKSPREISGIKIGEIRVAEPRPGGKGGGPARSQHGGERYRPY
jgi:RNA recognition motif-containing protein